MDKFNALPSTWKYFLGQKDQTLDIELPTLKKM